MKANVHIEKITGKATTIAQLTEQVGSLNAIYAKCEPTADEIAALEIKVNAAAAMVAEQWRKERISELLAMGNTEEMWREFLAHRECKSVKVAFNKKTAVYETRENMKGRVNYPELNAAYVEAETARLEKAGEVFDPAALTIAKNNSFNVTAPGFFAGCYKRFIDHNLGASACGTKSYELQNKKGQPAKGDIPSINKLVEQMNDLVNDLLPEGFTVKLVKADVRKMGVALCNSSKTELKAKGLNHAFNWLLNVIEERIEGKVAAVVVASETKTVEIPQAPAEAAK